MKPSLRKDPVKFWFAKIDKEKEAHEKYRKQAKESAHAARDDADDKPNEFNIHWANCRIITSAIYATAPKPDVRRRYQKPDPEEKELARLVERALEYNIDTESFETPSKAVVKDFVVMAGGVPRVIYDAETRPLPDPVDPKIQILANMTGEVIEPTFEQELEEKVSESVTIEQIPFKHFGWQPGHSDWRKVQWAYIKSYTNRKDAEDEYGVKLKGGDESEEKREASKFEDEIPIYEVFHKPSRKIYTITRDHKDPLRVKDDELDLQNFYPFPRPALDNLKSDELIPKPDYEFIKKLVIELNRLSQRRAGLVKHIKAVRLFDAKATNLISALESATDAANIPVTNMVEILESSGAANFERIVADLPMADRVAVVREFDVQIESVKQQIYEVIGISDIIRGATKASETAAAQQIKGQWANIRLNDKTSEVNRLWRDVLRMMAEIICEHFDPVQLQLMTGIEVTPRMREMMADDIGRSFAIDIETDSTILKDDQEERQQKLELVNVLLEKLGFVLPMIQQGTMPVEMVQEILLFTVSSHKHGKQLEDTITGLGESLGNLQNIQQLQQQLQQMQAQLQQAGQQIEQIQVQAGEQIEQVQQQAGQQINQLQTELGKVNERKEAREDRLVEIKAEEVRLKGGQLQVDKMDKSAEAGLDEAKTEEIYQDMNIKQVYPINEQGQ